MVKWKLSIDKYISKKTGKNLSLTMKKNIFGEFRCLLNYAKKMEYITDNPLVKAGNFNSSMTLESTKEMDYYTTDEFIKYISEAKEIAENSLNLIEWDYYVFFNIAFFTGLRKGEIHALKWSDIDDNILNVKRSITQKQKGGDLETLTKNKSSIRALQIPNPLMKVLIEHKKRQMQFDDFSEDFRICGGIRPLRDTTISNRNIKFADRAGLKVIRIHDFRHSHASILANEGINIQEVARRLGHSEIEETWNTYSHLYPREEERAISVLNKIA